ncbi:hypothetical protein HPB51_017282 [Rhipicephalus microplus]|uniref:Uncharacterized protein n=1 Tax=Rhipicephalus microplus TaxID=6941 RepID=A0A9J6ETY0_RHIMP|nr:hypothetical protein HPB51_017282 [Rhipicephalus microplus]
MLCYNAHIENVGRARLTTKRNTRCTRPNLHAPNSFDPALERFTDDDFLDMEWRDERIAALEQEITELEERLFAVLQELSGGHGPAGDDAGCRPSQGAPTLPGHRSGGMGDGPLQRQAQPGAATRDAAQANDCSAPADLSRYHMQIASVGHLEGLAISEDKERNDHASVGARDLEGVSSLCIAYEGTGSHRFGFPVQFTSNDGTSASSCCAPAMNAATSARTAASPITEARQPQGHPHRQSLSDRRH